MKSRLFIFLVTALAFGSAACLHADTEPPFWGVTHSVTIALTATYHKPGLQKKDRQGKVIPLGEGGGPTEENEYTVDTFNRDGDYTKGVTTHETGYKAVTVKIGNAEVLKDLLWMGSLPALPNQNFPSTSGWSLVALEDTDGTVIYARHAASKTLVPADHCYMGYSSGDGPAYNGNAKVVTTNVYNPDTGDSKETTTYSGSIGVKIPGFGSVLVQEEAGNLTGLYTESGSKTVTKVDTVDGEKVVSTIPVKGASKLDKIASAINFKYIVNPDEIEANYEDVAAVIEGSISLGAGTVVNLNSY